MTVGSAIGAALRVQRCQIDLCARKSLNGSGMGGMGV